MVVSEVLEELRQLNTHLDTEIEGLAAEAASEMLRGEMTAGTASDGAGILAALPEPPTPTDPDLADSHWADPRANDLRDDHASWVMVLSIARRVDENLYGALHGARCLGAKLSEKDGRLRLTGRKGEGWTTANDFTTDYRRWLRPYADQLSGILSSGRSVLRQ